ncbi:MAG: sodium-dependent transporter [Lachnospira sp.]|nr:sodium-dependent transporter [Lachnospira sp.]
MEKKRSNFSGGIGFVLAAAGSAVGLGNLWRFPYLAAQYGGGIFILVYIILALTFGFALMTTEIAIGRKTKQSPTEAYSHIDKRFGFNGILTFLIPTIILPYYCVIGGWVTKYVTVYLTGQHTAAAGESFFGNFISQPVAPLVFFAIYFGLTMLIVVLGVQKGIENVSKVLMPVLIVIAIGISIFVLTIPGSMDGLKYIMPQ